MGEEKLIFLISQPRSGSSLLQQLILNSDEISSTPESWQMLSLINTYRDTDVELSYNPNYAIINFKNHLNLHENGLHDFKNKIKNLALSLYSKNLNNKSFFLDKTPRYYHIIDELYELFPKAKFIFLVRNPLSVFSSILDYNFKGNLKNFLTSKDRQDDIFLAPNKIYSAINQYENNILVNYEDIILNPNKNLELIYKYLEVEIPEKYNSYKIDNQFKTSKAIDTKNLLKYDKPTNEFINSWQEVLNTTQKKKVALEFLKKLNYDIKPYFNYNLDDIIDLLKKHKPKVKTNFNLELGYYLSNEEDLSIKQILKKRIYQQMHKYD